MGTLEETLSRPSMALHHPRPPRRVRRLACPADPAPKRRTSGFLLPLTTLLSLLMLLGSLSVHAVSLQGRLRGDSALLLQTREDQLASAAQQLVARIQLRHACLLALPLEQWAGASCASAADLEHLRRGEVFGVGWQLLRWQPIAPPSATAAAGEQRLTLEIRLEARGREASRRAGFELRLAGLPWQVRDLRPLGLRGEAL
jgi:hypothetical protein